MNRRDFCKAVSLSCLPLSSALAGNELAAGQVYRTPTLLWLKRGGEELQFDYATDIGYRSACYLLRDVQASQQGHPDWRMLQTLSWMQTWLALYGHHVRFDALSGLRTPATNNRTENAAQNSFHLPDAKGVFRAIDFRANSIPSSYLGKLATLLQQGGVGFYQRDFIHIDTGNLIGKNGSQRIWRGY
ncbi:YcbK family protein [Undibacterium sp. SXout7W]|uniref:YcbK family protein n=1 Tax=Undibacterium sp. SXout7W TaxID=3413049 RepID=UPI003BF13059